MRIAIIGGGIGGLTTGLALRQFGFAPEIFEQAPQLLEVGAAIIMWPNAMRVLQRLGLAERVRRHGDAITQTRWLDQNGNLLNQVELPKTDVPAIALHRADLHHELLQALPENSIHLGHVFTGFEERPGEIVGHFRDRPAINCDLLIGADGLHSRARAQLLDDGPPADCGYTSWRGVVTSRPPGLSTATAIEIFGHGQRFGIGPIGHDRIGWWATANQTNRFATPQDVVSREELLRLFNGWCEPVAELIQATPLSSMVRNQVFDRRPVKKWGAGSMTLLGDAIHPTTPNLGQGGCLAIEDAAVLAQCLKKYVPAEGGEAADSSPITMALKRFERLRYGRTAAIARYSRLYGIFAQWENRSAVQTRALIVSSAPHVLIDRLFRWMFDYDAFDVGV